MLHQSNYAGKEQYCGYPYRSIVNKIAFYFGFQADEINELIGRAYASASLHAPGSAATSYKLTVIKALVQQCVRKISLQLFSSSARTATFYANASLQNRYFNSTHLALQTLPLHYRTVIILEWSSLTPREIGDILNVTPTEVYKLAWKAKEYLSRPRL